MWQEKARFDLLWCFLVVVLHDTETLDGNSQKLVLRLFENFMIGGFVG